jgi:fluoroacetyl-CoA thioesterase
MQAPEPGLKHEETIVVTENVIAPRYVPGTPPAFATPALVALIELTAANAIQALLDEDETSVGISLNLKHSAPTPTGMSVRCQVTLMAVDRRKLTFAFTALDDEGQISEGEHERMVVSRSRFIDILKTKSESK